MPAGHFTVRWTGQVIVPRTGTFTFYTESRGGTSLTVQGTPIINGLGAKPAKVTATTGKVALIGGQPAALELDYYSDSPKAAVSLKWAGPKVPKQVIAAKSLLNTYPRRQHLQQCPHGPCRQPRSTSPGGGHQAR